MSIHYLRELYIIGYQEQSIGFGHQKKIAYNDLDLFNIK